MNSVLNSSRAVGLRVKFQDKHGANVKGTIIHAIPNVNITVRYDPEYILGEWDDDTETISSPYTGVKLDYDAESMKILNKEWRNKTKTVGGPLSPMKHVKSLLTGLGRKRKTRKHSKKHRKTRKRI